MAVGKSELATILAEKTGQSHRQSLGFINAFIDVVGEKLAEKEKVQLTGFGVFEVRERKSRLARNMRTGETITVPATVVPVFKAGKALKERVK